MKTLIVSLSILLVASIGANAQDGFYSEREQAALEKAEHVQKKLLEGADFAELAKQYSDDPGSAVQGGELGFMGRGQLVPQYEKAALALAKGEISKPVKTEFGYHIIQLLEIEEGRFNTRHILI
ncbi:parvulin-like peptidyl-prolyl isomerase [Catalinimonas alkaloidigena]|uniref:peptidylprolyl isomerase n=1 Tax=Catalinimonas alkaloidigena TaxID=1075417 RepID=UPI0024069504|nr:peptidylprolyl isomerase [Catalinimonas alkaloidigena]MDF9800318.1 parvulin-like peptidyl-prolyl isomerase [Catalinimonas alkaloidigena]